jgi:hypothetical protein
METGTPSRAVMFDLLRKRVLVATRDQSPRRIDHDHEMCARASFYDPVGALRDVV